MKNSNTSTTKYSKLFADYIPAELREGKDWLIVYSILDPISKKLVRKRKRVPKLSSITERRKLAKKMIISINTRLQSGWNEIIENEPPKSLNIITDAINKYLKNLEHDKITGSIRKDTYRSYKNYMVNFNNWLISTGRENEFILNFN